VQSVAWVSERKDVLSTLFFMLTLWAYIAYVRRPGRARYGAIILFFAMGLLAKPMLVTLPFLLLLLDVWPLERLFTVSDADVSPSWISKIRNNVPILRERLLEKLPLFLLAAFSSAITFRVQRGAGAVMSTPLGMRLANVPLSYVAYIRKMFWPTQLSPLYPYPSSIANWTVAATVIALVVVSLILFKAGRRWRYCTAGWLWFLVGLTPVIGLVQVGTQAMADRYTYVPLIGLFIILAWGASDALSYFGRRTAAAVLIPTAFAIVLICAAVSRNEVSYWKDSATLWSHALAVTEDNYIAHTHLANELRNQGKLREAQEHYREAIRINASYPEPHNGLGVLLAEEGRILAAIKEYETVLKLDPMHALAHNNIANVLVNQRKGDEAIAHYRMAVRIKPDYADARNNLGVALINRGKLDEAILELREALRLKPDADVHYNLGEAYERTQHPVEAKSEYESALSLAPNHKPAADALRRLNR
jgi:tetratricopeptide (TPR) repeat protein